MSESVLDKAYMGQLVAVQHNRGAEGGRVFARALDLDLNLASNQVRTQILYLAHSSKSHPYTIFAD